MQHETSDALPLTLAGPGAPELAARLLDRYPELATLLVLEVRSVELERLSAALVHEGGPEVTTVYVALPSESETLAAALGLHGSPEMQHVPVVAAVADRDGGVARVLRSQSRLASAPFTLFGALDEALSPVLVVRGVNELLARGKHEAYVRAERAKSFAAARDNQSVVPWEELPESLRETNRRFADGIASALEEAGCAIVPAPLAQAGEEAFPLTDAQVEDLARHEHERWTRDLYRDGWRPTDGPKDADRRLHPLVVPWDGLGEEERQKDRDAIRAIPSLLRSLGFEIYRTELAAPPERPARLPRSQVD